MRETTAAQCPIHPMETQPCPAADPIADLCMQIRAFLADAPKEMPHEGYRYGELLSFAADALAAAQADARRARECDLTLSRVLHELAGHASLCWSPKPTGVFDTGEALAAVESAINELRGILRGNASMKGEGDA